MPELEKPISSLVDDNELLFVPRIDRVSQSPPVIFIRAESPLHCIHIITCLPVSLSLSVRSQSGRRLIYRLPQNRLRRRHCNDCNEVRPESGIRLQLPSKVYYKQTQEGQAG